MSQPLPVGGGPNAAAMGGKLREGQQQGRADDQQQPQRSGPAPRRQESRHDARSRRPTGSAAEFHSSQRTKIAPGRRSSKWLIFGAASFLSSFLSPFLSSFLSAFSSS